MVSLRIADNPTGIASLCILLPAFLVLGMNTGHKFTPEEAFMLKTLVFVVLFVGLLSLPIAYAQATGSTATTPSATVPSNSGCAGCAATTASFARHRGRRRQTYPWDQ